MTTQTLPDQILDFWFGNNVHSQIPVQKTLQWFPDCTDQQWLQQQTQWLTYIEEHFLFLMRSALQGGLQEWRDRPRDCLALILLLDQLGPLFFHGVDNRRHLQEQALAHCRYGMAQRFTKHLTPVELCFFYGPLLHAANFAPRSIGLKMLQQLLQEVRFEDNPYHQQRGQVLQCFYQALKQHAQLERELLQVSA
jgi:uncharacterized protein (DUF924 family)